MIPDPRSQSSRGANTYIQRMDRRITDDAAVAAQLETLLKGQGARRLGGPVSGPCGASSDDLCYSGHSNIRNKVYISLDLEPVNVTSQSMSREEDDSVECGTNHIHSRQSLLAKACHKIASATRDGTGWSESDTECMSLT
jgi:hypothetical protein